MPNAHRNAIKKMADLKDQEEVPFWRVIRKDKALVKSSAYEYTAAKLQEEGFQLEFVDEKIIKVKFDEDDLVDFR